MNPTNIYIYIYKSFVFMSLRYYQKKFVQQLLTAIDSHMELWKWMDRRMVETIYVLMIL